MKALAALFALLALAVPTSTGAGSSGNFTVYAAASLTEVFPRIDPKPRYSFAGSDQLTLQIRQGAPADVFASASPKYTQLLYHDDLVRKPVTFATNKLIVIVPKSNPANLHSVYDLRRSGIKLVIGDQGVPIGFYTRQLLDALGIKDAVLRNVVSQETDVKSIVAKVALGEADAGFVYVTDARPVASKVQKIFLPDWAQPPIRYQVAIVKSTPRQVGARAFIRKLLSKRGRLLLKRAGFGLPKSP
jgi:molybdate transport system substrate-binding protein